MFRIMCKGKIHNARVTHKNLNYEGSIGIDASLLENCDILPGERVDIFNLNSGARFSTYVIAEEAGSGRISLNGAAARLVEVGDKIIIVSYGVVAENIAREFKKKVLIVDEENRIIRKVES